MKELSIVNETVEEILSVYSDNGLGCWHGRQQWQGESGSQREVEEEKQETQEVAEK